MNRPDDWLRWLFTTDGFKTPYQSGDWTLPMQRASDISSVILFMSFLCILSMFLILSGGFFRERRIAVWFSAFLLTVALMFLIQGLMSVWPAHRFLILMQSLAALTGGMTAIYLLPAGIAERQEHHLSRSEVVLEKMHDLQHWLDERQREVNLLLAGLMLEEHRESSDGPGPTADRRGPGPEDVVGPEERSE